MIQLRICASGSSFRNNVAILALAVIFALMGMQLLTESRMMKTWKQGFYYYLTPDATDNKTNATLHSTNVTGRTVPILNSGPVEFQNVSIIITSSLIPNHPSINIIQQTIQSLTRLQSLPYDVPIFVTVDKPPEFKTDDDRDRLNEYIRRMQVATNVSTGTFHPFTNVKILVTPKHLHIAGSVHFAITEYVDTHFVYALQHDLAFGVDIDHYHLLQILGSSARDRPWLRNIRFRLRSDSSPARFPHCRAVHNVSEVQLEHGLQIFPSARWSDNNQLSTREYYVEMLEMISFLERAMEGPMMVAAPQNCSYWGQVVYGSRTDNVSYLVHLDGRHSQQYNETTMGRRRRMRARRNPAN